MRSPTPVLLLGTFHFADRGLDAYKPKTTFDVRAREGEVLEVIERLATFEPTKIAVERHFKEQEALNREYQAYVQGEFVLPPDEVYQLGFRLAKELGHEGLYGVNAWDRYYDPPLDLEKIAEGRSATELNEFLGQAYPDFHPDEDLQDYAEKHGQTHVLSEMDAYFSAYEEEDAKRLKRTLQETLRQANEPGNILEGHGSYMIGPIKIGVGSEYPGVDSIVPWYTRNLRIFANLQRITDQPDDRLLLIIGGGHVPILRHCVGASPEYALVEVGGYL